MRNPILTIVLVLLALIPIIAWGYTAYGAALTYNVGKPHAAGLILEVLAGLTPGFVGAILMAVGAFLLGRKPLGARVMATIGLVLIILTVAIFLALEGRAAGRELMIAGGAYVLVQAGVLVWLWQSRHRPAL
jgi:hypothetical protein